jgi:hypothetical protein
MKKLVLIAAVIAAGASVASAGEVYGGVGFPGTTVGYAHQLPNGLQLRGEYTFGIKASKNGVHGGATYTGNLKTNTGSALVDWFPYNNGFRVSGGLAFNDARLALTSTSVASVGGTAINAGSGATFDMDVKFPSVTPYIGIGYSSLGKDQKGWGFQSSVGLLVGKFDVNAKTNLLNPNGTASTLGTALGVTPAQVQAEANKVRDSLSSVSALPTFSLGAAYRF